MQLRCLVRVLYTNLYIVRTNPKCCILQMRPSKLRSCIILHTTKNLHCSMAVNAEQLSKFKKRPSPACMREEFSPWLKQEYNLHIELSVKENSGMPFCCNICTRSSHLIYKPWISWIPNGLKFGRHSGFFPHKIPEYIFRIIGFRE